MDVTVFGVSFAITCGLMFLFICMNSRVLPVVKAGKALKPCKKEKRVFGLEGKRIKCGTSWVDSSIYTQMIVEGNSMRDYNIHCGERIFVKKMTPEENENIKKYPVLVFSIVNNPNENDAEYKLRKFVGYVNGSDWESIYQDYCNRINLPKEVFVAQCTDKYKKIAETERKNLVLSETFDEEKRKIQYSLHPLQTIWGKVEFAV